MSPPRRKKVFEPSANTDEATAIEDVARTAPTAPLSVPMSKGKPASSRGKRKIIEDTESEAEEEEEEQSISEEEYEHAGSKISKTSSKSKLSHPAQNTKQKPDAIDAEEIFLRMQDDLIGGASSSAYDDEDDDEEEQEEDFDGADEEYFEDSESAISKQVSTGSKQQSILASADKPSKRQKKSLRFSNIPDIHHFEENMLPMQHQPQPTSARSSHPLPLPLPPPRSDAAHMGDEQDLDDSEYGSDDGGGSDGDGGVNVEETLRLCKLLSDNPDLYSTMDEGTGSGQGEDRQFGKLDIFGQSEDEGAGDGRVTRSKAKKTRGPSRKSRSSAASSSANAEVDPMLDDGEEGGDMDAELAMFGEGDGSGKRRRRSSGGGRRRRIPPEIAKMIGEANMHYISRDFTRAVEVLLQIVRQSPGIPDPYHTLGLIYEENGQMRKALEFYIIAAHLTPRDADLWRRLAQMSRDLGNEAQSLYCMGKAWRADPTDMQSAWNRVDSFIQNGDHARAARELSSMLRHHPRDATLAREAAKEYNACGNKESAAHILERTVEYDVASADLTLVNMLAELYLDLGYFGKAISLIGKVKLKQSLAQIPIELIVKLGIAYLLNGDSVHGHRLFDDLNRLDVREYSDLYFDVAEALVAANEFASALTYYEQVIAVEEYNRPHIWYNLGRCHRAVQNNDLALEFFEKVLEEVPDHVEARLALSDLYRAVGDASRAVQVLSYLNTRKASDPARGSATSSSATSGGYLPLPPSHIFGKIPISPFIPQVQTPELRDMDILFSKATIHFSLGQYLEFAETLFPMYMYIAATEYWKGKKRHIKSFDPRTGMEEKSGGGFDSDGEDETPPTGSSSASATKLVQHREGSSTAAEKWSRRALEDEPMLAVDITEWTWTALSQRFNEEDMFGSFLRVCKILAHANRFKEAFRLLHRLIYSGRLADQARVNTAKFGLVGIAYRSGDFLAAYDAVRFVVFQHPASIPLWTLFSKIINMAGNFASHQKFLVRSLLRHPQSVPLTIMVAHNSAASGSYRLALGEYFRALRRRPNDALICLCIAVAYLNTVMNRRNFSRHYSLLQCFAFLQRYLAISGRNSESMYNMGRAFHQLGISHFALFYYERALRAAEEEKRIRSLAPEDAQDASSRDMTSEIAYNIHLIYRSSGNNALAQQILMKHCVI